MDRIKLHRLAFETIVGILPRERIEPQRIEAEVTLSLDLEACAKTGELSRGIDYAAVMDLLMFVAKAGQFELLESYCYAVSSLLLHASTGSAPKSVTIEVTKPEILAPFTAPAVCLSADTQRIPSPPFKKDGEGAQVADVLRTSTVHVQLVRPAESTRWQLGTPFYAFALGSSLSREERTRPVLKQVTFIEERNEPRTWVVISRC